MAIVKMNKFTLLTFDSCKEHLLKELQKFENVHFKDLQKEELEEFQLLKKDSSPEVISGLESELVKVKFILEKIKPFVEKPKGLKAITQPLNSMSYEEFDSFTQKYNYTTPYGILKEKDEELKTLQGEKNKILVDNEHLKNWIQVDVSLKEVDNLKNVKAITGTLNKNLQDSFRESFESQFSCSYLEFLGTIKDEVTLLLIVGNDDFEEAINFLKNAGFSKISLGFEKTPQELMDKNHARLTEIIMREEELLAGMAEYAKENDNLLVAFDYLNAAQIRAKACDNFLCSEKVTFIEGWVPKESFQQFEGIIETTCGKDYYLNFENVEHESKTVPIKLKNNKLIGAFEDITSMYSLPQYSELDPTGVLAPFYILFFGIMVGDFGYGAILFLVSAAALLFGKGLGKGTKNFMKFLFVLSFGVMGIGLVFGSAFGVTFFTPMTNPVTGAPKAIIDTNSQIVTMLIMSIGIGIFQIIFGLLVKAYMLIRDGHFLSAIFDSLFYITTLFGGIGMILSVAVKGLPIWLPDVSKWMFIISMVGLALTQGRESPSIGGKIGNGLYAVYGLTSYVGDIVSYTRLVALALSGAYIAFSFNLMGGLLPDGPIGFIGKALVIVFGQTLNLGLSVLGAYVHSCRLQYVEYFGKFYEGGGKVFRPLELKNTHINIIK